MSEVRSHSYRKKTFPLWESELRPLSVHFLICPQPEHVSRTSSSRSKSLEWDLPSLIYSAFMLSDEIIAQGAHECPLQWCFLFLSLPWHRWKYLYLQQDILGMRSKIEPKTNHSTLPVIFPKGIFQRPLPSMKRPFQSQLLFKSTITQQYLWGKFWGAGHYS